MKIQSNHIIILGNETFLQTLILALRKEFTDYQFISAFSLEAARNILSELNLRLFVSPFQLVDGDITTLINSYPELPGVIFYKSKDEIQIIKSVSSNYHFWPYHEDQLDEFILYLEQSLDNLDNHLKIQNLTKQLNDSADKVLEMELKHSTRDLFNDDSGPLSKAEHQLVEEALRESELMYRTLFESAPVGMCLATIDGNVFGYNEAMMKLIGDSTERSLENFNLSQLFPKAEDYDNLLHEVQTMGFIRDIEGELVNAEGYVFFAIMNITFLTIGEEDFLLTVFEDITMRKFAEAKLADYTDQLREANAELYQYAYAVAHDIRAPLRAIRNYADFLNEDLTGELEEEQQEYLDNMVKSVSDAEQFVADLLELSRVGRREVDIEPIALKQLIQDLVASLDLPKNMQVHYPDDLPIVLGERTLLKQVFLNLITNGMKFNQSDVKQVDFSWRILDPQNIEIRVQDNGIGIKPEYHEQIFRVFERLHTKQEYDGTGVGLAIVKKAIVKMQGQVQIESEIDKGSTFIISLMKAK